MLLFISFSSALHPGSLVILNTTSTSAAFSRLSYSFLWPTGPSPLLLPSIFLSHHHLPFLSITCLIPYNNYYFCFFDSFPSPSLRSLRIRLSSPRCRRARCRFRRILRGDSRPVPRLQGNFDTTIIHTFDGLFLDRIAVVNPL